MEGKIPEFKHFKCLEMFTRPTRSTAQEVAGVIERRLIDCESSSDAKQAHGRVSVQFVFTDVIMTVHDGTSVFPKETLSPEYAEKVQSRMAAQSRIAPIFL